MSLVDATNNLLEQGFYESTEANEGIYHVRCIGENDFLADHVSRRELLYSGKEAQRLSARLRPVSLDLAQKLVDHKVSELVWLKRKVAESQQAQTSSQR